MKIPFYSDYNVKRFHFDQGEVYRYTGILYYLKWVSIMAKKQQIEETQMGARKRRSLLNQIERRLERLKICRGASFSDYNSVEDAKRWMLETIDYARRCYNLSLEDDEYCD